MRTRKPLKPRMTGRLAPGANVVAAMPGREPSASPSVEEGWLSSCWGVTTVVDTKFWSGEICSPVPARSGAGAVCWGAVAGAWVDGAEGVTGLGVVTVMPGSWVCAWAATAEQTPAPTAASTTMTCSPAP